MIALGFEDVVVFIFDFPAGSSPLHNERDSAPIEGEVGDEGIVVMRITSWKYELK